MKQSKDAPKLGRPPLYPWDEWIKKAGDLTRRGYWLVLEMDTDYHAETHTIERRFRRLAAEKGLRTTTRGRGSSSLFIKVFEQ